MHLNITTLREIKRILDDRLEGGLSELEPNYDDSITGFNLAWDIVRATLAEKITGEDLRDVIISN
jgi:hypothetical protein